MVLLLVLSLVEAGHLFSYYCIRWYAHTNPTSINSPPTPMLVHYTYYIHTKTASTFYYNYNYAAMYDLQEVSDFKAARLHTLQETVEELREVAQPTLIYRHTYTTRIHHT